MVNKPTVLLTDSYIDSESRRIVVHTGQVCDVCGFCHPATPDDGPPTPLEYWEFEPKPLPSGDIHKRRSERWRAMVNSSVMPIWTTQTHLNRVNCRERKI